jgi:hypothetical protein
MISFELIGTDTIVVLNIIAYPFFINIFLIFCIRVYTLLCSSHSSEHMNI